MRTFHPSILLLLIAVFSCNRPEVVYPIFDGSSKLTEVHHIYRDPENADLIVRKDIFTIHYNSDGRVTECFENDRLLYRCIYKGNMLTQVETDIYSEVPSTIFDIKYSEEKVSMVTYTFEQSFSLTWHYEYLSKKELIRYDTTGFEDDVVINKVHFTENQVESMQINPSGTYSSTERFKYSTIPSFASVFGLPTLPILEIYLPLGINGVPSEMFTIAANLPSQVENDQGVLYTIRYEFQDGLVRKYHFNSLITNQLYEVVLIWN